MTDETAKTEATASEAAGDADAGTQAATAPDADPASEPDAAAPEEAAEEAPEEPRFEPDPTLMAAAGDPVRADAPAGDNARYDAEYEELETEVGKQEAIDAQPVNWRHVVELGTQILKSKSKDFTAASFLARGLADQKGYAGVAEGLAVMRTLAETYWDDMFPPLKRARARAGAMESLAERLDSWMEKTPPGDDDALAVIHAAETILALEDLLNEKLGDKAPALGDLRRRLTEHARDAERALEEQKKAAEAAARQAEGAEAKGGGAADSPPERAAAESAKGAAESKPAQPGPSGGGQQSAAAAPAPSVEVPSEPTADVSKALRQLQGSLRSIASHLRQQSLGDPRAYRLLRTAMWLPTEQLPPHDGGQTQIPAPDPNVVSALETMASSGNHSGVVGRAEDAFVASPFWLDCHRFTATALEALGHGGARKAVESAVRNLLDRLPQLPELRLAGGQPMADEMTRQWLGEQVLAGGGGADVGGGEAAWSAALRQAREAAGERGFEAGLAVFRDGLHGAASQRDRFMWGLNQAKFSLGFGRPDVALPQLQALDDLSVEYRLDRWEPELMIELAKNLLLCYRNIGTAQGVQDDRQERMPRLARLLATLDAVAAADLLKT